MTWFLWIQKIGFPAKRVENQRSLKQYRAIFGHLGPVEQSVNTILTHFSFKKDQIANIITNLIPI